GPPGSTVYKRVITRTGGDSLTGRPATITNTDTLLAPQPVYARGMRRQVGGADAQDVDNSSGVRIAQRYELTVSVNAMSMTDLENPDVLILLKDDLGNQDLYRIDDFEPIAMQGTNISWLVYITNITR